jgi:hypothetical protein
MTTYMHRIKVTSSTFVDRGDTTFTIKATHQKDSLPYVLACEIERLRAALALEESMRVHKERLLDLSDGSGLEEVFAFCRYVLRVSWSSASDAWHKGLPNAEQFKRMLADCPEADWPDSRTVWDDVADIARRSYE